MKNKQNYLDELHKILPQYFNEYAIEKIEINSQNFVETTGKILRLISLQPYHSEAKNTIIKLCEKLQNIELIIPHDYCLFTGRIRIIYTFLRVYESLKDEKYLMFAKSFLTKGKVIDYVITAPNYNGLLKGRCGVLMGLLYLDKYAPELELGDIINYIYDEILKNIIIDKYGITNFYPESNFDSMANLAAGNAGLIYFFTTISQQNSRNHSDKIMESLLKSLNGQWTNKWSNWKDNSMKISSVDEHFSIIEQFKNRNIPFFKSAKNKFDFWEGSLGICMALVNYLTYFSQENQDILSKIELCLATIEKKENDNFKLKNSAELYFLYKSLDRITNTTKYESMANLLLENPAIQISTKVSLLLSILENENLQNLNILPTFDKVKHLPKDFLKDIQNALILRYYPKTIILLNHIEEKFFESNFLPVDEELTPLLFTNFDRKLKNCSLLKSGNYKKIMIDSFKFEQFKRKNIQKHQNKILLKVQEIVQFSEANEVLNLEESALDGKEFIVADNVYMVETKWDWLKIDKIPVLELVQIQPFNYYELIKVKPNNEQKSALSLSENQLIFLEIFYEKTSIENAKILFLENFNIESKMENQNLLKFVDDTIEQFVFNRVIILAK